LATQPERGPVAFNVPVSKAQRWILRPLLAIWAILSLAMAVMIIVDALAPAWFFQRVSYFQHRFNLESPEWQAALEAKAQIPEGSNVGVTSGVGVFLYTLRYQIYPSRVYSLATVLSHACTAPDSIDYWVAYQDGSVTVTPARVP
jgi:hypothetical protein